MPVRRSPPPGPSSDPKTAAPAAPKLRDSCDPCASSKLKCSKEKPTCARCAKRGITCEYVATKRGGRKPINRASISESRPTSGATSATSTNPNTPPTSTDIAQLPTPFAPTSAGTDMGLPSPNMIHGSPLPMGSGSMDYMSVFSSADPSLFSTCPSDMSTDGMEDIMQTPFSFNTMSSIPNVDILAQKTMFSNGGVLDTTGSMSFDSLFDTFPAFDDALLGNLGFPTPSSLPVNTRAGAPTTDGDMNSVQDPLDTQCSCLTRALRLMGQLFQPSPNSCIISAAASQQSNIIKDIPPQQSPTIETVISENETTVEAVGEMLCCPCSHDGYLLTILSLIISKVLGRYAAAGHNTVYPSSNTSNASTSGNGHQSRPSLSRTRSSSPSSWSNSHPDPPIAGSYGFDSVDHSARMAAQLVLSKLHHVRHIVNELSPKLRAQAARNAGRSSSLDSGAVNYFVGEDVELASPLSGVMARSAGY